ncbi:MAG: RNA methyltransferase, partial [Candidatus Margulisbacteria bacterium]|nr:RNA methyltransferase [Candidatus Margulisiibacteriota bacterium]
KLAPKDTLQIVVQGQEILTVTITTIHSKSFSYTILNRSPIHDAQHRFTLAQALPKQDKMTDIFKKCTEIGVSEFIPVLTERCVSRPKDTTHKITRWKKAIESAASQSKQQDIPLLHNMKHLKEFISYINTNPHDIMIVPWEETELDQGLSALIPKNNTPTSVCVFIGPEGGLSITEIKQLQAVGFKTCSLGLYILRTENAGFFTFSQIRFALQSGFRYT